MTKKKKNTCGKGFFDTKPDKNALIFQIFKAFNVGL